MFKISMLKEYMNKSNKFTRQIGGITLPFLSAMIIKKDDCLSQFREWIPILRPI